MKKIPAILAASMLCAAIPNSVIAADSTTPTFFLCMQGGSSMAYISEDGVMGEYKTMKSSNGSTVKALVIDGSTYLPFRFLAELSGWQEGEMETVVTVTPNPAFSTDNIMSVKKEKTVANTNVFKFESKDGVQKLLMRGTGNTYERIVGEDFEYTVKVDGKSEKRNFCIQNIDGNLYMPLRYMADMLNAKTDYDSNTGNIYFASTSGVLNTFVDINKSFRFEKSVTEKYKLYDNPLMYSEEYLASDGTTVSTVSSSMGKTKAYSSVSRNFDTLYYINDADFKVYTKNESDKDESRVKFYTKSGSREDIQVDIIFNDGEHLWGLRMDTQQVFRANLNGKNLEYIPDSEGSFNLLYREYENIKYVFYMKSDLKTLVRIEADTMHKSEMAIVNSNSGYAMENAALITIGKDSILYKERGTGNLHYLPLYGNIYTDTWLQIGNERVINSYNNVALGEIQSMNYDDKNGIIYFACLKSDGSGGGLYYYDTIGNQMGCLRTSSAIKARISIIDKGNDVYKVSCSDDTHIEEIPVKIILGKINIDGNITLNR